LIDNRDLQRCRRQRDSIDQKQVIIQDAPAVRELGSCGWQQGYGAFSMSIPELLEAFHYIQSRAAHHRPRSFREEYRAFPKKHELAEIRAQIRLELSHPSAVSLWDVHRFLHQTRHFAPGFYYRVVPPGRAC
jgi:hypothetical protein